MNFLSSILQCCWYNGPTSPVTYIVGQIITIWIIISFGLFQSQFNLFVIATLDFSFVVEDDEFDDVVTLVFKDAGFDGVVTLVVKDAEFNGVVAGLEAPLSYREYENPTFNYTN